MSKRFRAEARHNAAGHWYTLGVYRSRGMARLRALIHAHFYLLDPRGNRRVVDVKQERDEGVLVVFDAQMQEIDRIEGYVSHTDVGGGILIVIAGRFVCPVAIPMGGTFIARKAES